MTTAGAAAARISHDYHKVALIQIIGLRVAGTMRVRLFQSHGQPVCPAKLAIASVARSSEQHRQPLPRPIVLRKPDVNGDLHSIAHLDIQSRVPADSGWSLLLSGEFCNRGQDRECACGQHGQPHES